jgi:hypothetical protein
VCFKNTIYGLRQALGEVDFSLGAAAIEARYDGQDAILCNSLDGVRARIDAIEAERSVRELTARLQEMEAHGHDGQ